MQRKIIWCNLLVLLSILLGNQTVEAEFNFAEKTLSISDVNQERNSTLLEKDQCKKYYDRIRIKDRFLSNTTVEFYQFH